MYGERHYRVSPWWTAKTAIGLTLILYSALGRWILGLPSWIHAPEVLGQFVVVLGGATNLLHYAIIKRSLSDVEEPSRLVVDGGLFGVIRHPMYLGDALMMLGFLLLHVDPLSITLAEIGLFCIVAQCDLEDDQMIERFGPDFEAWRGRTKRILPYIY